MTTLPRLLCSSFPRRLTAVALVACAALLAGACGGDEPEASDTSRPAGDSSTEEGAHDDHGGHGGHADASSMGIEEGTVDDVAALGEGPSVGDRWEVPVGLNVCGRFIEAPLGGPVGGVTAAEGAMAVVEPTTEADAGHAATVADWAEAAGIGLSTGRLQLPDGVSPSGIEVTGTEVPLSGATFSTGDECGGTPAEVQLWVYSADAVRSGEGVYTVTDDPEQVPFVEDGMALVIALTPESSLPTLPPSALGLG